MITYRAFLLFCTIPKPRRVTVVIRTFVAESYGNFILDDLKEQNSARQRGKML